MARHRQRRPALRSIVIALAVVLLATSAATTVLALERTGGTAAGHAGRHHDDGGGRDTLAQPVAAETVSSITPTTGTQDFAPDGSITVTLSQPLAPSSPYPTISPNLPGSWSRVSPTTLVFEPDASFVPYQTFTVTVPGGDHGLLAADGARLEASQTIRLTVAPGSTQRLEELLAQLGYLPLVFKPADPASLPASQEAVSQPGTFSWRWADLPASLTSLWTVGSGNPILRGAVMTFQAQHGLAVDGDAGPVTWAALLAAVAAGQGDKAPWDYVYVRKTPYPEMVTVWSDGRIVYETLANTGVPGADTPDGTFEVFDHIPEGTMTGKNLNGTTYSDPGIRWISYFFKGDALHAYPRASYGFPQSLGCVEMPTSSAQAVWPYTPVGTVVTVQ